MEEIKPLSDSELQIMEILWKQTPPVSRSILEKELTKDRALAPSTIITFLTRLCDKGYLEVTRQGRTNLYTPLLSKQDYLSKENRSFIDRLYHGSMSSFAVALCNSGISKDDLEELRKMLEENQL